MARPRKNEGASAASLSDGTTTPDAGASTALASPVPETSSPVEEVSGLATEGVAETAPTLPIASSTEATTEAPIVEEAQVSRAEETMTITLPPAWGGLSAVSPFTDGAITVEVSPSPGPTPPMEVTTPEQEELPLGAKLPQEVPGVPAGVTLEELTEMGLPLPGTILTCALFETGKPEEGIVVSIHVELDVVNVWLRNSKRMWPVPAARIDGAAWTHVNEDYPDPTVSASFDRLHRSEAAHPANVPAEWLIISTDAVLASLSAQGKHGAVELAPLPSSTAASLAAQTKALLGIPEHYTLCKILGLGSISGHGHRASDGKAMEDHAGGSQVYFPAATVRKLGHILEIIEASTDELS